jgi:hypothetical protein
VALQTFTAGQVLTAAQVTALQTNDYNQTVSNKTDSYTLVAADKGTRVVMNKATATTITVNTSLFAAGDTLWIHNIGAGVCTITAGTATVSTSGSLALAQNSGGTLYFTSTGVAIFFPTVAASAQGLTLLNTTSFSAVSSISAPASTFTSTYGNYKILFDLTSVSLDDALQFRMRSAGSDDTGANYNHAVLGYNTSNVTAGQAANVNDTRGRVGETDLGTNNHSYSLTMDMFRPNEVQFTTYSFMGQIVDVSGIMKSIFGGGWIKTTTQYDSITFYLGGNFAGRMSIYGYNL